MFQAKLYVVTVCCSLLMISHSKAATFPADIPRCQSGDTNCVIRTSLSLIRQHARKGYPAAAFPVVEPFHLKQFDISDGRGGSLSLKLNFRDVDVLGLSTVNFDRAVGFTSDPNTSKFEMYGSFPKITIRAKYTADGRILILPIRGDGNADIILENSKFSVKFKPSVHPKGGKNYLMVEKLKVLIEPQKMNIKLTNLFNGDQALGAHMNQFLNENWFDVWSELQPSIHTAIAEVMKSILTPIFKKFAYEDMYLSE
ncbi:protein takeout-like [Cochliomyia hominivorax]